MGTSASQPIPTPDEMVNAQPFEAICRGIRETPCEDALSRAIRRATPDKNGDLEIYLDVCVYKQWSIIPAMQVARSSFVEEARAAKTQEIRALLTAHGWHICDGLLEFVRPARGIMDRLCIRGHILIRPTSTKSVE